MKILNAEQLKAVDEASIAHQKISSWDLMERAATACLKHITALVHERTSLIHIVCGKGNNGGDGMAIARLLNLYLSTHHQSKHIRVYIIEHTAKASADFTQNYQKAEKFKSIELIHIHEEQLSLMNQQFALLKQEDLIVDALFGYGLNKAVEGIAAEAINIINAAPCTVVSIDLPSGLFADKSSQEKNKYIVRADLTLTFQMPKLAFMMAENALFTGDFILLDIGLDKNAIEETDSTYFYTEKNFIAPLLLHRGKFSHKGSHGHALLIAGSKGKTGAAILSAKAGLRSGAGLMSVHTAGCGLIPLQTQLPDAMVSADEHNDYITQLPDLSPYKAVGMGPGIGTDQQTANVLKLLIQNFPAPLVLDADALNILSENKTWLAFLKAGSIITPHRKEFDRLFGKFTSDFDRLEAAMENAARFNLIIVLKGAHTAIVTPSKKVYFNSSGNPGMAKGGTGDVLTGIITGLMARGYEAFEAAMLGVYLHGLSADIAIQEIHEESLMASDVIHFISAALQELNS